MGFLDKLLKPVGDILGFGGGEGGYPVRVPPAAASQEETLMLKMLMEIFENPEGIDTTFDPVYYLKKYPDVAQKWAGTPEDHYNRYGKNEAYYIIDGEPHGRFPNANAEAGLPGERGIAAQAYDNAISEMERAKTMYEEISGVVREGLEPISGEHREELAGISRTPGIALSFGGKPVMTTGGTQAEMRPLRTMGTLKELAESRYQSALQAKMAELGQMEALPGRLTSLAEGRRAATIDPMTDLFKTLFTGRMGTPIATPEYRPTFLEQLLPIAGQVGAGWATGAAQKG